MDFRLTEEQLAFQAGVRDFIEKEAPQELLAARGVSFGTGTALSEDAPVVQKWLKKLHEKGYAGMSWPVEYGGKGETAIDDWLFSEEMSYHDIPSVSGGMYGKVLAQFGTEEQKRDYIPGMLAGTVRLAQGWTEPRGGTDLAGVQTRATREGDEYVINGQKIFTTSAHYATHIWLIARTNPEEPRHRGLSMLIVPMDAPGIEVRPLYTQADERTNEVFFDSVRTPVTSIVGEENGAWLVAMKMAEFERITLIGHLAWFFDELVKYAKATVVAGKPLSDDPRISQALARLAVDLEVGRLLELRTAWQVERGGSHNVQAAMNKLWVAEFRERLANEATNIIGPPALIHKDAKEAPLGGFAEAHYRAYPLFKFGAGCCEVLRNIIAQRGLGMPRG